MIVTSLLTPVLLSVHDCHQSPVLLSNMIVTSLLSCPPMIVTSLLTPVCPSMIVTSLLTPVPQKDSDFQAELRHQQQNLTAVLLQLQQLQNRVNALPSRTFYTQLLPSTTTTTTTTSTSIPQPATTAGRTTATARTTTTTTDPLLVKLESAVPQLEARVSRLEKDYLSDVADLTHNVTFLLDLVMGSLGLD